jgi:simple sugar transport system permease protein
VKRWLLPLVPPSIAVVAALLVGAGFILAVGQDPVQVYGAMASGVFGNAYGWGQVLFKATPLVFTGLAVALGFRAGLFNIGAEGQALMGSFVMGVVGSALAPRLPGFAVNYFGHAAFVHETVHTPELPAAAMLPRLGAWWPALQGSPVNLSLFLAAIACVVVGLLLWRTPFGYELRATGMNPRAAEYGGTRVPSVWVKTMALSGALSALVGVNFVFGYKGYFESGFTSGVGFLGIAVALLGRTHPVGVVLAAFFFGALSQGGLVINSMVPKELVDILQAIVILMAIVSHETVERWMRKRS